MTPLKTLQSRFLLSCKPKDSRHLSTLFSPGKITDQKHGKTTLRKSKEKLPVFDHNSQYRRRFQRSTQFYQSQNRHSSSIPEQKNDMNELPFVSVEMNGEELVIEFPTKNNNNHNETSISLSRFHAQWLWSNCPNHIHRTGARKRFPGMYNGEKIMSAEILPESFIRMMPFSSKIKIPVPSPPGDYCHPLSLEKLNGNSGKEENNEPNGTTYNNNKARQKDEQMLLCIQWDTSTDNETSDDLYSCFNLSWLEHWKYDEKSLYNRRLQTEIKPMNAIRADDNLLRFDYARIINESQNHHTNNEVFDLLQAIFTKGAAIIENTPTDLAIISADDPNTTPVALVSKILAGGTSHGNLYGDVFQVKSVPSALNIAYTSDALTPHQDLSYYESIPGLQLLHCVKFGEAIVGGESILIDAMAAAYELREKAPHHFRTLVNCPATFVKQRKGVCMTYRRPHIVLDHGDNVSMEDIDREIVAVNWSPPFEGPLSIPGNMVVPYYEAYSVFQKMLDNSASDTNFTRQGGNPEGNQHTLYSNYAKDFTWEQRLKPGEILVFNNRRLLHGRREFYSKISSSRDIKNSVDDIGDLLSRHLIGSYTNIDDTLNRYRVLLREKKLNLRSEERSVDLPPLCNVGNGTSIVP